MLKYTLFFKIVIATLNKRMAVTLRGDTVAAVAETGFSHRLTAYKFVGHFFVLSYLNKSANNQVEILFFRFSNISVACLPAQLGGRTVIIKL